MSAIRPLPGWRESEQVREQLRDTPQPAIVIMGGQMYIFENANVNMKVHIVGGVLQFMAFDIEGVSDNKGVVGKEVFIGVDKMSEIVEKYKVYEKEK